MEEGEHISADVVLTDALSRDWKPPMQPEAKKTLSLVLKVLAYLLAAYSILLFLDGARGNDTSAVIVLFVAVGFRVIARRIDLSAPGGPAGS